MPNKTVQLSSGSSRPLTLNPITVAYRESDVSKECTMRACTKQTKEVMSVISGPSPPPPPPPPPPQGNDQTNFTHCGEFWCWFEGSHRRKPWPTDQNFCGAKELHEIMLKFAMEFGQGNKAMAWFLQDWRTIREQHEECCWRLGWAFSQNWGNTSNCCQK